MKKFDSINIIPFVDIMLVLLAIILVTSTLVEKKLIPLSLAKSSSEVELKSVDIDITITKDNRLFFNNNKVSKDELLTRIKSLKEKDTINISCDKDAKFKNFVYVLDALKSNNLNNISIVTKRND